MRHKRRLDCLELPQSEQRPHLLIDETATYIHFGDGDVAERVSLAEHVIVDLDARHQVIGLALTNVVVVPAPPNGHPKEERS